MIDGQPIAKNSDYTAQDIQVLGGLEAVRRRPGMYIGSTDQRGLQHLVYEIVYNTVDEAMAGCCNRIVVNHDERQLHQGRGQRPRHSGRHPSPDQEVGAGNGDDHAARRGQIRRQAATRSPAVCTASALQP